ncbi:hypothetical protein [Epibacterium ulvae]|uniref:hypothetical protein n=1 Tax=Epibacterium ulvae TaxID=1156985 RepID=UPI0024905F70|nr:hypothetical protein [Epibacterium ulvae]
MTPGLERKAEARRKLWDLAKIHNEFSAFGLSAASGRTVEYVHRAIKEWINFGYVRETGRKSGRKKLYETIRSDEPPVTNAKGEALVLQTAEQSMWYVMRHHAIFSAEDVQMLAHSDASTVKLKDAVRYCELLLGAGYLRIERPASEDAPVTYRLIRNTGRISPVMQTVDAIWDENTQQWALQEKRIIADWRVVKEVC